MKNCLKCGCNLAVTSNFDEKGNTTSGTICENEECITHSNGYDAEDAPETIKEELQALNPTRMMQMIGNKKAIQQNSQTRTKKRWLKAIFKISKILDLLGYKIGKK